jgi:hypothetical protein
LATKKHYQRQHSRGNALRRLSIGLMSAIAGGTAVLYEVEKKAMKRVKQASGSGDKSMRVILQDDDGHIVLTNLFRGNVGQTIPLHLDLPTDWEIKAGQVVPDTYTFHKDGNSDLVVKVQHLVTSGTEKKTIHRTITIEKPGGHTETKLQSVTFERDIYTNHAREKTTYGKWDASSKELPAFEAPIITGYHPDKKVAPVEVTPDSNDLTDTIKYLAD